MTGILGTRIMAALAALFNFLALNLALLVCALPVITLPAAVSAATRALDRWRRDGEDAVVREFLIGFRVQWARQTTLVGVPLAAAALGVVEVRHFAIGAGVASRVALGLGTVALLVTASALGYVFLLAARAPLDQPMSEAPVDPVGLGELTGPALPAGFEPHASGTAAEFWTECVRLGIRNLFVTGPLFLTVIGGAAILAWIDPPLLLLGLPLLALQLMRVTADLGLRRLAARQIKPVISNGP